MGPIDAQLASSRCRQKSSLSILTSQSLSAHLFDFINLLECSDGCWNNENEDMKCATVIDFSSRSVFASRLNKVDRECNYDIADKPEPKTAAKARKRQLKKTKKKLNPEIVAYFFLGVSMPPNDSRTTIHNAVIEQKSFNSSTLREVDCSSSNEVK